MKNPRVVNRALYLRDQSSRSRRCKLHACSAAMGRFVLLDVVIFPCFYHKILCCGVYL